MSYSGSGISHNTDVDGDLYIKFKKLQKQLEFLQVQEDYIKDELKNLRTEYLYAQEEVKRIQSVPLVIGQFLEAVDQNYAIVGKFIFPSPIITSIFHWEKWMRMR